MILFLIFMKFLDVISWKAFIAIGIFEILSTIWRHYEN